MKHKIIFFGNGMLSEYALAALEEECEVIFHARNKEDLTEAVRIKSENPEAHGVLASFGVLIPSSVLEVFEMVEPFNNGEAETRPGKNLGTYLKPHPEGILNIHPSLLPLYRGASPIESAILNGDTDFGVSVMKLVKQMDAGPVYGQATLEDVSLGPTTKDFLYKTLAEMGAATVLAQLKKPSAPVSQDDTKATYCGKFEKKDGILAPEADSSEVTLRKIIAFQGFPKPKYAFYGKNCIVLEAHIAEVGETALLSLKCADGRILSIDKLQPEGRKAMDAKAFLNGIR